MIHIRSCARITLLVMWLAVGFDHKAIAQAASDAPEHKDEEQSRVAFSGSLPSLDGTHLKATIVEVTYGPGESSPPHSHPCAVIGYVIRGALRSQVKGEREAVYKAGQTFYEPPNGIHLISANASSKVPTKFLAYFVCDHATPLTVAPSESPTSGGEKP